jgi:hypothetical protein
MCYMYYTFDEPMVISYEVVAELDFFFQPFLYASEIIIALHIETYWITHV